MTEQNGLFIVFAFVVALIVAYATTPLSIKLAFKIGALDVPKDNRRMHKKPIPRIGGIAIVYGFLISVCCFSSFMVDGALNKPLIGILIGSMIISVLGFLDDLKPKPALLKFVIQIAAACIPVLLGVRVIAVANPMNGLLVRVPEWLSIGGSVLWIVELDRRAGRACRRRVFYCRRGAFVHSFNATQRQCHHADFGSRFGGLVLRLSTL